TTRAVGGMLARDGNFDVAAAAAVPAGRRSGDPRRRLTLDQLLHMTSGLANEDDRKDPASSLVVAMMFGDKSSRMAEYAASVPLAHGPGTHVGDSTATS